ncbi:reverse transcriptase domain-containing protein [Tanacetum coccineum]
MNPRNFTLPCTIESLNFYAMADLCASANVIPKTMFEHLKLAQLKKTDMLVEIADMTKISPIRIVKNVLVKVDKFLSDFMVMDMLSARNETMILGRPFLATIHAEIDVFNKEISLGIGSDRVTFDMNKKIHNFTTPIGEICMINSTSSSEYTFHTSSDASSRVEKIDDLHNENNYCNQEQGRKLKFWPACDPNIRECNGGPEIYGMDEEEVIKKWYRYHDDDRERINGGGLSFPEFQLVKYGETQEKELIWDDRRISIGESSYPKPKEQTFKDWLLTKVGHTNVSKPVKKTLLNSWLIDCFREDLVKDPRERSFDDYKWMFDLEVDQLANEYELGIGKK